MRARRLERSALTERSASLVDVARQVGGIHAQVQASAELQLAARVDGVMQADVRSALWEQRTLVKAWTVRGTLHIHPAGELALWHAARRAVLGTSDQGLPEWRDPAGVVHPALDAGEVEAARAAVWETLDGRCLLREDLVTDVVKRVGKRPRERLRSGFAFFLGELCQGPPQGSRITLARPDQWIDGWREMTDEREALREACRRFIHAYGPARPADFCAWVSSSAFKAGEARSLFDELALEEIDVEGGPRFVLAGDTSFPEPAGQVSLLPEYDVYVMGFASVTGSCRPSCASSSRSTAADATRDRPESGSSSSTGSPPGSGSGANAASASSWTCSSPAASESRAVWRSSARPSG